MKIKVWSSSPAHSCSYYRSWGPISKLPRLDPSISVELIDEVGWVSLADTDILYLESPMDPILYQAIVFAKNLNVKVIVDIGDDLLNIPEYSPAHNLLIDKKEVLKKCIGAADVVTCLSEDLRKILLPYNQNIVAVPNAFNDYNYKLVKENSTANKVVNWRGNDHHVGDIVPLANELSRLAKNNPEWIWSFMGYNPVGATSHIRRKIVYGHQSLCDFFRQIKEVHPAIQIKPLTDNSFNRCKSNIAFMEGVAVGAVAVGPDFPEWRHPGIATYTSPHEFESKLQELMRNVSFRNKMYNESFEFLMDTLRLSIVNQKRLEIVRKLESDSVPPPRRVYDKKEVGEPPREEASSGKIQSNLH